MLTKTKQLCVDLDSLLTRLKAAMLESTKKKAAEEALKVFTDIQLWGPSLSFHHSFFFFFSIIFLFCFCFFFDKMNRSLVCLKKTCVRYMGDGPKGASKAGNWMTLMSIVGSLTKPELTDEVCWRAASFCLMSSFLFFFFLRSLFHLWGFFYTFIYFSALT